MSDPGKISRDVKGLVADFREELKLRDPWDREIDIQFKRIQRRYKELLFDFPFARQAQSVDQALWTDTSYALITRYRARIDPVRNSSANNKNVVENRKILQKFLAFLAAEGSFWSGIALRLVRAHGLHEANKALTALGIDVVEFENRESLARRGANAEPVQHGAEGGDIAPPSFPPPSPEHRSNKLLAVFRTLIFLGDLARYREQYGTHPNKSNNENGRRPRGGRRGRDKQNDAPPEKRYAKAEAYYLQARLLLPDYGNPFNQLAIVYSYQHDLFGAALNYYRALCVRRPFPTAKDNLLRTLTKCLEADREMWRVRRAKEAEEGEKGKEKTQPESEGPGDLETKFKQDVVLLHALWAGKCRPPKLARHTHNVLASFASLTDRRLLPAATLVQVLVLVLGALWKVRMFRDGDKPGAKSAKEKGKARDDSKLEVETSSETRIVAHILALCTVLLELGTKEIEEGVREATESVDDAALSERLAQRITGTFRRTLPALRIASKWVKSNVEYIQRHATPASESKPSSDPASSNPTRPDTASFWLAWARFSTQLAAAFPLESLRDMTVTLEEDVDMKGFAPLKRGMSGEEPKADEVDAASVHPNEEQLMRIGDLIVDAKFIVNVPGCPISYADGSYIYDSIQTAQARSLDHVRYEGRVEDLLESEEEGDEEEQEQQEDDRATVSTRTEDDPVRLAMDAVLSENEDDQDDEEEEEEILYPQKPGGNPYDTAIPPPQGSALPAPGPQGPSWPPPAPSFLSDPSSIFTSEPVPQPQPTSLPKQPGTTAQDLLDRVLSGATGPGTPPFLNGPGGNVAPSMHGPTPSFLRQNSSLSFDPALNNAFASMSPFPSQSPPFESPAPLFAQNQNPSFGQAQVPSFAQTPTFMRDQNSTFPTQPFSSQLSPFPSQRSPGSPLRPGNGSSAFATARKVSDPAVPYFPSHTRVASLSGATSIWTPAPQEAPHLSMPSRTGSMRANSMSASMGVLVPSGLPGGSNVWAPQEGDGPRSPLGFGDISRSRTFGARTEASQWQ
ncbi:hypothetical protein FRC07_000786 [Ceratobasidium sp. 392]|nr:hypothetical protein FRC07_000786 [Ceratobasidium sp. 392]